jgi:hypothetical protein
LAKAPQDVPGRESVLFIVTQFSNLYTSTPQNKPLEALIDRLQAEQHLEMMWLLVVYPQEGTEWEDG